MNFYNATVTSNTSVLANNLSVNGNLTVNGTGILSAGSNTINLKGNWNDRATAGFTEGTSIVNFNGTALQTITTPSGENFTNLTVNNSGVGIQLLNNVTVATTLTMTQGNIDLNNNILTLGLSTANKGTLARTNGTLTNTGSFTRWFSTAVIADGAIAGLFPVGTASNYRPFYISAPVTAPTTGGTITVAYMDAATNSSESFADGVSTVVIRKDLNWTLSTANSLAGGLYNLRTEGTGFGAVGNINDLRITLIHTAPAAIGTAATNAGTTSNPQSNRTGLSSANIPNTFYIASINASSTPLPITLISFTATVQNGMTKLDWETSNEFNNDYFTTQRSINAEIWEDVKRIKGSINTTKTSYYTSYDENPNDGLSYYRLRQTDFDQKNSYSSVRSVTIIKSTLNVYPNPATNYIKIESPSIEKIDVVFYNIYNQIVDVPSTAIENTITYNVSGIPTGIYLIKIMDGNYMQIRMVSIENHE